MLELKSIYKDFFGVQALKNVTLTLQEGEILGLVGENGAGKSTLMNILFGMPIIHETGGYQGEILFDGKPVIIKSAKEAMDLGIGMIHQEFMLIPGFSVAENIKLNREPTKSNIFSRFINQKLETLDMVTIRKDSKNVLQEIGLGIDELLPIIGLPVGYKQFVEIAREVDKSKNNNIKVLVFDEPTAVLTESEAGNLLKILKQLTHKGISILFISHRLDEVLQVSDRVVVLRDGEKIAEKNQSETNIIEIAELMVGRKLKRLEVITELKPQIEDSTILKINNLKVSMPGEYVNGINLEIKKGEIFGLGGLAGHGKVGIANGIAGLYSSSGEVWFQDKPLQLNNPYAFLNTGLAFLSEDRRGVGLLLNEPINFNICLTSFYIKGRFTKNLLGMKILNQSELNDYSKKIISDLDIRCLGPHQFVRALSGGNQQKVCIARALTMEPKLLFVSEPTRGVDVGAKQKILEVLVNLNRRLGMTIVFTSSELLELRSISDRIGIVHHGQIADILPPDAPDVKFGLAMSGIKGAVQ